jgi:alpha-galactosidase
MGWNSWNAYHCDVDADKIMAAANAMASNGFKDAGYMYVNSDDCWSNHNGRDNTTHQLLPNMTKFPEGIKGLADKIHDMGLKFGIYSTAGMNSMVQETLSPP